MAFPMCGVAHESLTATVDGGRILSNTLICKPSEALPTDDTAIHLVVGDACKSEPDTPLTRDRRSVAVHLSPLLV